MKIKAILLFFIISALAISVNTASAAISITDAEAIYETNLSSANIPTDPVQIKNVFLINTDASLDKNLSSVSIPTYPSPLKEVFIINEDASLSKNLSSVSIPTYPSPLKEVFIINEDASWNFKYNDTFVKEELFLIIDYPEAYQLIPDTSVLVRGTAYSPHRIANVTVNEILANGTANWSAHINLTAGVNTITAKAIDNMSYSKTISIVVFHYAEGEYIDSDGDGVIDAWDMDNSTPPEYWVNPLGIGRMLGDFNNNGMLDSGDVTIMMRKIVGLE